MGETGDMPVGIHVYTVAFDHPERIRRTIRRFKNETIITNPVRYTLVSCRYPLPDPDENEAECIKIAEDFDVNLFVLSKNYGQDGNFLKLVELDSPRIADNDLVVFFDTDNAPNKNTWLNDALTVFKLCPQAGYLNMACSVAGSHEKNQGALREYGGIRTKELCWPGGFSTGIYRGSFFKRGITQTREFYGGTEWNILESLRKAGLIGLCTIDHDDLRDVDGWHGAYLEWKAETIVKKEQTDFEDWCRAKGYLK
jgi:hypothetical protein